MTIKKRVFTNFITDIRNGSSHSVDFLLKEDVQDCLSVTGIEVTRFHTKAEITQKEVEAHLDKLRPCRENAFLFRRDSNKRNEHETN